MNIDPKISYWINVIMGILLLIGTGTISLTNFVDSATAAKIASAAAAFAMILNIILHGYSGPQPGPMNKSNNNSDIPKV